MPLSPSPSFPDPQSTEEVNVRFTSERISKSGQEPVSLIDCRELEEFEFAHLEGAILLPLSSLNEVSEETLKCLKEPMIVYCHHGVRSLHLCRWLRSMGKSQVFSMSGGIEAWSCEIDSSVPRY